jgi:hypothetical protein
MKNITENPQSTSDLLKSKIESFQIEELDNRLEMHPWMDFVCKFPEEIPCESSQR